MFSISENLGSKNKSGKIDFKFIKLDGYLC